VIKLAKNGNTVMSDEQLFVAYMKASEVGQCQVHPASKDPFVLVIHPKGEKKLLLCTSLCERYLLGKLLNSYYRKLMGRDRVPVGFTGNIPKDPDSAMEVVDAVNAV